MIKLGYVRTSRTDLDQEVQITALVREGIDRDLIFQDLGMSGIVPPGERPGWKDLQQQVALGLMGNGQVQVYVFELSRLGRSFLETLNTINDLEAQGVQVISVSPTEAWSRTADRKIRDLILSIFAWVAERERDNLIERTRAGLQLARSKGVKLGRPELVIPWKDVKEARERGLSWSSISRLLDIPYGTLLVKKKTRKDLQGWSGKGP